MEKPICLAFSPAAAAPEVKLEYLLLGVVLASLDCEDAAEAERPRAGSPMWMYVVHDEAPHFPTVLNQPAANALLCPAWVGGGVRLQGQKDPGK